MKVTKFKNLETQLIHAGEPRPRVQGAINVPIFQSSTFERTNEIETSKDNYYGIRYIRLNNTPNHQVLHQKLSVLEQGEDARVTSSGMAAISSSLLAILSSGDHLLVQKGIYGGTYDFITKDLSSLGISFDFIDGDNSNSWERCLKPNTRAIYVESVTNPLMQVGDLQALVQFAKAKSLVSFIDNTFLSPVNFRPITLGFDLSLHSGTKYLNGHSDIAAGAIIGRSDFIEKIDQWLAHLGGVLDPHACFLLHRGMKTLALRVQHQNQSALKIAEFLEDHPSVSKVNYPGLKTSVYHQRACRWFDGFGGMLSFELKEGLKGAKRFIKALTLSVEAPSLGGVETLITRPATTSHLGMNAEERLKLDISDALIRLSVGLESTEDLLEDFDQALNV